MLLSERTKARERVLGIFVRGQPHSPPAIARQASSRPAPGVRIVDIYAEPPGAARDAERSVMQRELDEAEQKYRPGLAWLPRRGVARLMCPILRAAATARLRGVSTRGVL